MKLLLLAFVFYGLAYYLFEAIFNWFEGDFFDNQLSLKSKLKLKPHQSPSLWMFPVGAICGFLIHLYLMIPINYLNIFALIGLGFISCIVITGFELLSGWILNIKFDLDLWYYDTKIKIFGKEIKLNFKNQIDILHSIGWFFIGYLFLIIDKLLF